MSADAPSPVATRPLESAPAEHGAAHSDRPRTAWAAALRYLGVDFHVGLTLIMRLWIAGAGVVTLGLIPSALSKAEQGYFFTFSSILALQIFFELGFNFVVQQMVGHEMSQLSWSERGELEGPPAAMGRLKSLLRLLRHWYVVIAVLFAVGVGTAGQVFFESAPQQVANWRPAWWLIVLGTAANLLVSPFLAVLEGAGRVGHVARLRLVQSVVGYLVFWGALLGGAGLLAAPAITVLAAAFSCWWLARHGSGIGRLALSRPTDDEPVVRWRRDIFPLQWRIAVSWASGYLIFQLFNPLVFAVAGPVEAGRIGLSLAVFSAVLNLAMSWITAKTPVMATLIARGERAQLNATFRGVWLRSGAINALVAGCVVAGAGVLHWIGHPLATRIAATPVLVCMALTNVANHSVFAMAAYMRAHKEEPMLWTSVVAGLATLGAMRVAVSHGTLAVVGSATAVTVLVALPWTWRIFRRYYLA